MKILFNSEALSVTEMFFPQQLLFKDIFLDRIYESLKKSPNFNEIEFRTIVSERTFYQDNENELKEINPIAIFDNDIKKVFPKFMTHTEIIEFFYNGEVDENQKTYLKSLYKEKLDNYEPDIIIHFEFRNKLFDYLYPNALQLVYAGGVFKRAPFMTTISYDPCGGIGYTFLNEFKDELNKFKITEEQNNKINQLKISISNILDVNNPVLEKIQFYKEKFQYLILVPLQFSGHYGFDVETRFKTQWDYLSYVLDNIPENIGVVVTEHGHNHFLRDAKWINDGFLNYYKRKYENFIYFDELVNYPSSSLYLLNHIDGIINISSVTAILGVFFDKKIISLGDNFNDWFKDSQGLENLREVLNAPSKNKNNIIYWYLTHYLIFPLKCIDGKWLYEYLEDKLNKFRTEEISFEYYNEIENIHDLTEYIIGYLKEKEMQEPKGLDMKCPFPVSKKNIISKIMRLIKLYFN